MIRWTQAVMKVVAAEERAALGLGPYDRFDPHALAKEHGISVFSINELPDGICSDEAVRHFETLRPHVWSAALVPFGTARLMLVNSGHELVRQRSNMAHELGHYLLEHEFREIMLGDDGCVLFDAKQENQAKFIARELLVPEKAAYRAAYADDTNLDVAERFGVSTQFAQMCMSGPRVVAQRARAKQARSH